MIIGVIIGVVLLAGLAFAIYKMETAPTFEQIWPNHHQECSDCNEGGETCPTCPFRDKDYTHNTNWASGQDDVPRPPDGIITFSEGKTSKAYIEAKDGYIQAALDVVMQAIAANSPEHHLSVLKQVHAHLMRALL